MLMISKYVKYNAWTLSVSEHSYVSTQLNWLWGFITFNISLSINRRDITERYKQLLAITTTVVVV